MFFIISKTLGIFLSPIIWIIVIQIVVFFINKKKLKRTLMLINVVLFLFFSNNNIIGFLIKQWESEIIPKQSLALIYDYGIVPGGISNYYYKYDRVQFGPAGDRLLQAIDLYKEGNIRKIILTGGSAKILNKEEKEMVFVRNYLLKIGIPEGDVLIESESRNTYENAKNVTAFFGNDTSNYLLITSAFHMPRALACFTKQGLNIDGYPVNFMIDPEKERGSFFSDLIPSTGALGAWNLLLKEWIGYAGYKIKGYL